MNITNNLTHPPPPRVPSEIDPSRDDAAGSREERAEENMHIQQLKCQPPGESAANQESECNGLPATGSEGNVVPAGHQQQEDHETGSHKLAAELQRLRQHLIQVEEGYTEELLLAEDREKQLRTRLANCEQQIEHLEHQLRTKNVAPDLPAERQQRDRALVELSQKEDRIHSLSAANERLQLLLDQSRKDWEEKLQQSEKRVTEERQRSEELMKRLKWQEDRVTESASALAAAARVADQMEAKQAQVTRLQEEVTIREKEVRMLRQELESVQQTQPGKIDKHLVKNLVLSYFSAPADQKAEAQRLLALILDLDLTSRPLTWQRQATTSDSSSLSAQFVRFLEAESATNRPTATLSSGSEPVRQLAHSLMTRGTDRRPDSGPSAGPSHRQQ